MTVEVVAIHLQIIVNQGAHKPDVGGFCARGHSISEHNDLMRAATWIQWRVMKSGVISNNVWVFLCHGTDIVHVAHNVDA